MSAVFSPVQDRGESVYFLSDVIGLKVLVRGRKIGKLNDLAIREHEKLPEVTHLVVGRPFGRKPLLVPWERVVEIAPHHIVIDIDAEEEYEGEPEESQILLRDHVLDKKVIDLEKTL